MAPTARSKKARKKPPPGAPSAPCSAAGRSSCRGPHLEPHHIDILALALIAVGIFLGGVAYLDWSGGALGDGAVKGTRFVFGALGYAVPAALVAGGALILARELRPPGRPMRTGTLCLTAALTLGPRGGHVRARAGNASRQRVLARHGVRVPRGCGRTGRAVDFGAPVLDARREHPGGVPVRGRADPRDRCDAGGNRSRHRRRDGRNEPRAATLDRGDRGECLVVRRPKRRGR